MIWVPKISFEAQKSKNILELMDFFSELINAEKTALKIYYEKTAG